MKLFCKLHEETHIFPQTIEGCQTIASEIFSGLPWRMNDFLVLPSLTNPLQKHNVPDQPLQKNDFPDQRHSQQASPGQEFC
jgi:hypothetical protein